MNIFELQVVPILAFHCSFSLMVKIPCFDFIIWSICNLIKMIKSSNNGIFITFPFNNLKRFYSNWVHQSDRMLYFCFVFFTSIGSTKILCSRIQLYFHWPDYNDCIINTDMQSISYYCIIAIDQNPPPHLWHINEKGCWLCMDYSYRVKSIRK